MTDEKLTKAKHIRSEMDNINQQILELTDLMKCFDDKADVFVELRGNSYRIIVPKELRSAICDMLIGFYDRKDKQLAEEYEEM